MVSKESHKDPGLLFFWIFFGFFLIAGSVSTFFQPSLLSEYGFVLWVTIAWWGLPLTFVYLIPSYAKSSHRKKELKKKQKELERKEKGEMMWTYYSECSSEVTG